MTQERTETAEDAVQRFLLASTERQGLPRTVEDEDTLRDVARRVSEA